MELRAMETLDARARLAAEEKEMGALVYRFLTEMLYNRENIRRRQERALLRLSLIHI